MLIINIQIDPRSINMRKMNADWQIVDLLIKMVNTINKTRLLINKYYIFYLNNPKKRLFLFVKNVGIFERNVDSQANLSILWFCSDLFRRGQKGIMVLLRNLNSSSKRKEKECQLWSKKVKEVSITQTFGQSKILK